MRNKKIRPKGLIQYMLKITEKEKIKYTCSKANGDGYTELNCWKKEVDS